jgi:CRP/FNR family cyclic AMP-dependent transcriptional regulator
MTDKCVEEFVVSKEAIKASPLGAELSDDQCEMLAEVTSACGIRDRAFLIEEGQKDDALHVITSGMMEVVSQTGGGDMVTLQILRPGDMIGEMGFIDGVEHSAGLRAMLQKDPDLVYKVMRAIMRTVHRILRSMNLQYVELTNYIAKQHGRY